MFGIQFDAHLIDGWECNMSRVFTWSVLKIFFNSFIHTHTHTHIYINIFNWRSHENYNIKVLININIYDFWNLYVEVEMLTYGLDFRRPLKINSPQDFLEGGVSTILFQFLITFFSSKLSFFFMKHLEHAQEPPYYTLWGLI